MDEWVRTLLQPLTLAEILFVVSNQRSKTMAYGDIYRCRNIHFHSSALRDNFLDCVYENIHFFQFNLVDELIVQLHYQIGTYLISIYYIIQVYHGPLCLQSPEKLAKEVTPRDTLGLTKSAAVP
jgi:hypothetical protein